MSAQTAAITSLASFKKGGGSTKINHEDGTSTNSDMMVPLRKDPEDITGVRTSRRNNPKVKFQTSEDQREGLETKNMSSKIYRRVRDVFHHRPRRAPLKLESIRILRVKEVSMDDGKNRR